MNWKDLMPHYSMVRLLVAHFFPRWLQVLVAWLNHTPNYEEIAVWYTGWKGLFPADIASDPQIQGNNALLTQSEPIANCILCIEQFTRALDLMNRSLAVGGLDYVPAPVTVAPPPVTVPQQPTILQASIPQGFRELVEYRCAQQGILFVPLVNRFQAGRPMFRIGNLQCYFDGQVLLLFYSLTLSPVYI